MIYFNSINYLFTNIFYHNINISNMHLYVVAMQLPVEEVSCVDENDYYYIIILSYSFHFCYYL